MLRVKDSLPEGTIAAALVVEATEENSSESDLSVIFWKRLLLQRIGENELGYIGYVDVGYQHMPNAYA